MQRLFGGSFLAGNIPLYYSRFGARLIVPDDTQACYAAKEFFEARGKATLIPPALRRPTAAGGVTKLESSDYG